MFVTLLEKCVAVVGKDTVNRLLSPRTRSFLRDTVGYAVLSRRISSRVDPKTVLLAEYPRCGVTWLRFLIATGLHHQRTGELRKLSPDEMETYAPNLAGDGAVYRPYRFSGGYSVLKTHRYFDPRFERAIVLYRDPFDAIRSYYAMELMVNALRPAESLSDEGNYLTQRAAEFIAFYGSWLPAIQRQRDQYLLIKYEDLLNPAGVLLRKVYEFLRIDAANLTAEMLQKIAGLYDRSDANFSKLNAEQRTVASSKKADIFKKAALSITPDALERDQPAAHEKLKDLMHVLDGLRCRIN